jgi:hypothetical protein
MSEKMDIPKFMQKPEAKSLQKVPIVLRIVALGVALLMIVGLYAFISGSKKASKSIGLSAVNYKSEAIYLEDPGAKVIWKQQYNEALGKVTLEPQIYNSAGDLVWPKTVNKESMNAKQG